MFDDTAEDGHPRFKPRLCLEYGIDETLCDERDFTVCERGMVFTSRWRFELGTQLALALSASAASRCARLEGIVVECEEIRERCFRSTLLFLDVPEEMRAQLASLGECARTPEKVPSLAQR